MVCLGKDNFEDAPSSSPRMKAFFHLHWGDSKKSGERVGFLPIPSPGKQQVLVKVFAASLNPTDWKTRNGAHASLLKFSFPRVFGMDFSGEVEAVGEGAEGFQKGDEVFGMVGGVRGGTVAEYVLVDSYCVAKKPEGVPHSLCAAVPLVGITSVLAFRKLELKDTERLLVTGGAGGVGSLAMQIAREMFGMEWVACTASEEKRKFCEDCGADEVFNYKSNDCEWSLPFSHEDGHSFQAVFDTCGDSKRAALLLDKEEGRMVSIVDGATAEACVEWLSSSRTPEDQIKWGVQGALSHFSSVVDMVTGARSLRKKVPKERFYHLIASGDGEICAELGRLLEAGVLKPPIDSTFSLEEAGRGMERLESGRCKGKVIIQVREEGLLTHTEGNILSELPGKYQKCNAATGTSSLARSGKLTYDETEEMIGFHLVHTLNFLLPKCDNSIFRFGLARRISNC